MAVTEQDRQDTYEMVEKSARVQALNDALLIANKYGSNIATWGAAAMVARFIAIELDALKAPLIGINKA